MKRRKILAAASSLAVLAALLTGCGAQPQEGSVTAGVLTLRVNPEIAIYYNTDGKVVALEGDNQDGREIVEAYPDYIGKDCEVVVQELVEEIHAAGYFVEEVEGQPRRVVLELDDDSQEPREDFLKDMSRSAQDTLEGLSLGSAVVVEDDGARCLPSPKASEAPVGVSDYNDTDYGPNNDGVTDYNDTDYGPNNDGVTDYDDTDYGPNNDGVTDYNDTDYGPNNDGVTDYNDTDYGPNNDGVTDYVDTDYGPNNDGVTDYDAHSCPGHTHPDARPAHNPAGGGHRLRLRQRRCDGLHDRPPSPRPLPGTPAMTAAPTTMTGAPTMEGTATMAIPATTTEPPRSPAPRGKAPDQPAGGPGAFPAAGKAVSPRDPHAGPDG